MRIAFLWFFLFLYAHGKCQEANFNGLWKGNFNKNMAVYFEIETKDQSSCSIKMDVPVQSIEEQESYTCKYRQDSLFASFKLPITGALAKCILTNKNDTLFAQWKQSNRTTDIFFTRVEEIKKLRRPQEPMPPFDYNQEEVLFTNKVDSIQLSGTYTSPNTEPKYNVILIPGSGPQNRNSEFFNHKPFLVIADYLTNKGIGVLRFDERGVGKSEGNQYNATSLDFSKDIKAAIAYLREEKKQENIILIGHSEGALIAQLIAAEDHELNGIILLAGPGIHIKELMLGQNQWAVENKILPKAQSDKYVQFVKEAYELIDISTPASEIYAPLQKLSGTFYNSLDSIHQQKIGASKEQFYVGLASAYLQPWFRYFINYNPGEYLNKITCPILALNGDKDVQVNGKANLEGIEATLKNGACKNYQTQLMPSLNHLFQTAETGDVNEYATIEETFSEEVLKIISEWILANQ